MRVLVNLNKLVTNSDGSKGYKIETWMDEDDETSFQLSDPLFWFESGLPHTDDESNYYYNSDTRTISIKN